MKNKKVMIVEDDSIIAMDIELILKSNGYIVVDNVQTGESAVLQSEKLKPDLILMDIYLREKMTGIEAAKKIQQKTSTPILFLTAFSDDDTVQESKIPNTYGYILKPVHEKELVISIEIALHKSELDQKLLKINDQLRTEIAAELEKSAERDWAMIRQNRMAEMGDLLFNLSHHWRQPLNNVALAIQNIQDTCINDCPGYPKVQHKVDKALQIILGMSDRIDQFRKIYQPENQALRFNVKNAVNKVLALIEPVMKSEQITVHTDLSDDCSLSGFENEFIQILLQLIHNARDAIQLGKTKEPSISIIVETVANHIQIKVADNAGGVPEPLMEKIFTPYYTTKQAASGLGLYMARMIIEKKMNGSISVLNINNGAEFTIVI